MALVKSNIRKVEVSCNNCGSTESVLITKGIEHEYDNTTDDVFNVVRCNKCGLFYLNPRPDISELKTIYPDSYYAYVLEDKNKGAANKNSALAKARKNVYVSRLKKVLGLCKPVETYRVLDVGCGDGRALNWYRELDGYNVETHGVDFDEQAVEKARAAGHHVYTGTFEDAPIPRDYFDLVVATHVIEHVADPKKFAATALAVLKPGGVFLCETPNAESWDAKVFRQQHWGGYHFPRHWVLYTPESIRFMAESIGFIVERIDFNPAPAFWNWTGHSVLKSKGLDKAADALFPPVDFQKNNLRNFFAAGTFTVIDLVIKSLTGTTSNMAVVLRKPE